VSSSPIYARIAGAVNFDLAERPRPDFCAAATLARVGFQEDEAMDRQQNQQKSKSFPRRRLSL
jgi:hypothetical protein